jgi:hypothetical protein
VISIDPPKSVAPPVTAYTSTAKISPATTAVVVKSVRLVLRILVPEAKEIPAVLIESALVGLVVPVALFHIRTVIVPTSAVRFHAEIVPV